MVRKKSASSNHAAPARKAREEVPEEELYFSKARHSIRRPQKMTALTIAVLAVIALSFAGKLFIISQAEGLWWDEAVYLGLGKALLSDQYTLEPGSSLESFRPPLMPLLESPFYWSPAIARGLVAVISLLSVLAVYYLAKEALGKAEGLLAALFTGTSYLFTFFSCKLMSEPLFILLTSFSLLFFAKWLKSGEKWELSVCGVLAGLAFMSRYLAYILVIAYILYFLAPLLGRKMPRLKPMGSFLFGLLISLVPWFWIGLYYYGNPAGAFITNFSVWAFSFSQTLIEGLWMLGQSLNFLWLFIAGGLFMLWKRTLQRTGTMKLMLAILLMSVIFFLGSGHKEARYLLSFLPVYSFIAAASAGIGLRRGGLSRAFSVAVIAVLPLTVMFFGLNDAWLDRNSGSALYQASLELSAFPDRGEYILTQSYPYAYLAGIKAVNYCESWGNINWEACQARIIAMTWDPALLGPLIEEYNVTYVLSDKFEPMNTGDAISYFERNFEKVRIWEQWSDPEAVVVYRIKE